MTRTATNNIDAVSTIYERRKPVSAVKRLCAPTLTKKVVPSRLSHMVSDIWVYRATDKLITQHGAEALKEATRLIQHAVETRQNERALLMLRVRLAVRALQRPPSSALN